MGLPNMRRKELEIKDEHTIIETIKNCDCLRIGMVDDSIYIVPVNFGFEYRDSTLYFYFHGAYQGRKYEALSKDSKVGFEMDCKHQLNKSDTACNYSFAYESVIGNGRVSIVEEPTRKRECLSAIMEHYGATEKDFPGIANVCVYELKVTNYSCKRHL